MFNAMLKDIRQRWLAFTDWLKASPTRYRITVALCIPTVPVVTLLAALVLWMLAMPSVVLDGCRAFKAGRPI